MIKFPVNKIRMELMITLYLFSTFLHVYNNKPSSLATMGVKFQLKIINYSTIQWGIHNEVVLNAIMKEKIIENNEKHENIL